MDRPNTGTPQPTFLVERYWPGVTVEAFLEAANRLESSVDRLRRDGIAVRTVGSTLVPGDEAAYWILDAPSQAVVARACEAAGLPVVRIVDALELRDRYDAGRLEPVG